MGSFPMSVQNLKQTISDRLSTPALEFLREVLLSVDLHVLDQFENHAPLRQKLFGNIQFLGGFPHGGFDRFYLLLIPAGVDIVPDGSWEFSLRDFQSPLDEAKNCLAVSPDGLRTDSPDRT